MSPEQPNQQPQEQQSNGSQASPTPATPAVADRPIAPAVISGAPKDIPEAPAPQAHTPHKAVGIGLGLCIALLLLFLSPLLPGKVLNNSPGSSSSFSSGSQSLSCTGNAGPVTSALKYTSKKGFPITYGYTATSSVEMSCNGSTQSASGGQSNEFSTMAIIIDVACAAVVAFAVTKVMRTLTKK
jgi:hypothetical protein